MIKRVFRLSALAAAVVVFMPLLWLAEPFWRFRFGAIMYTRIGHIALDVDLLLRRWQLHGKPSRTTVILFSGPPANEQLLKMWKRHFPIFRGSWWMRLYFAIEPILVRTRFHMPLPLNSCEHREFSEAVATLSMTPAELDRGLKLLKEMGIDQDAWFVCFHARSSNYLRDHMPDADWSYHDFRDCSIENYLPAAEYVTAQGGYAIRMGTPVDAPLPATDNSRIIDYATKYRSDFMDIFLISQCRFFLCSSSGLMCVARVMDVPIAPANYLQFGVVGLGRSTLYIPKLLRNKESGCLLTMSEIASWGLLAENDRVTRADYYEHSGLEWVENTPEEILGLCQDMMAQLSGAAVSADARELQERYLSYYDGTLNGTPFAGRISPQFATRHRDLITGAT